jgi:hypothetical protein
MRFSSDSIDPIVVEDICCKLLVAWSLLMCILQSEQENKLVC